MKRKLDQAWQQSDAEKAEVALRKLASKLEEQHPGAAASLREGLEEPVTVIRLGVPALLRETLRSTNPIESAIEQTRKTSRNVKRWRHGQQVLRWCAGGLRQAEKGFRRVKGYRELPVLAAALAKRCTVGVQTGKTA